MIMLMILLIFVGAIFGPMGYFYWGKGEAGSNRGKKALIMNLAAFSIVFLVATVFVFSSRAYGAPTSDTSDLALAAAFIAAALVTGLGAIGTGIAVSSAAAAAIGAVSENENNFGKSMIFVAMAEGIAIYGLLISFMILGRV